MTETFKPYFFKVLQKPRRRVIVAPAPRARFPWIEPGYREAVIAWLWPRRTLWCLFGWILIGGDDGAE